MKYNYLIVDITGAAQSISNMVVLGSAETIFDAITIFLKISEQNPKRRFQIFSVMPS